MFHWFNRNVVRARLPIGERVYAIGDIHGEVGLLQRLLDAVERDGRERGPARTTMVLIGDVIDRGGRSAELLRALRSVSGPVLLKGNHEAMMVAACRGDTDALDLWLRVGGQSTLAGFGVDPGEGDDPAALLSAIQAAIDPALVDWMDALPTAWSMGDYFFAHAGIRPGIPLHRQSEDDLLWIRGPFLSSRSDHGKVVVHGHSIEPGVPRLGGNRIGLDTGAHEHRLLTALGLEDDRQWLIQVSDDEAVADPGRSQANRTQGALAAHRPAEHPHAEQGHGPGRGLRHGRGSCGSDGKRGGQDQPADADAIGVLRSMIEGGFVRPTVD